jgi:alkaline phosphatase
MYQGKWDPARHKSTQVYDGPGWVKVACTTYPLTRSGTPTGTPAQDPSLVYDPRKAWQPDVVEGAGGKQFAAYRYLSAATDSAAAGTALASGVKTYNHAINWSNENRPLLGKTVAEITKAAGRSVGTITTVFWSDATPATLGGAHNADRQHHREIANEMLAAPYLDVIMGAGHPDFDNDGRPARGKADDVGGPETWAQLKSGKHPAGWRLIQTKAEFESLTSGPTPRKVVGSAQVHGTLQESRGKYQPGEVPFSQSPNPSVPTLAVMARGALNVLGTNPNGLYLHIEGGAVDWANHANQGSRMIEEQIDFNRAVEAVVHWVESNSNWDETLVILTADHECGMLWGEHSDAAPFDPIADSGPGRMPKMRYNSKGHTNSLVPLYARGPGAERLTGLAAGSDPVAAKTWTVSPNYVDDTSVFVVMHGSLTGGK